MNSIMSKLFTSAGALGALNLSAIDKIPMHLIGVPGGTIFMAFVGSMLFHSWDDDARDMPRKRMYVSVVFFTGVSSTLVAVVPLMLGWEWYSVKLEGSLAFLLSIALPYMVPVIKKLLPELFRKWFRLGDYNLEKAKRRRHYEDDTDYGQ